MNFDFLKPDSTLVPRQAHLCGWEGLSNICSALLTSFYERSIFTQAVGENRGDNWLLKLTDTPLSREELAALLEALHADDYDWDANDCGEYPIWELSQGVAMKLVAMALPFSVEVSHAADDGVWFIGSIPEEKPHIEFYETKQGRIFYEDMLPRIVAALEKIAGSLSTPTPSLRIAHEISDDFLTDLYWGNYDPSGGPDSDESVQCSAEIRAAQDSVKAQVTQEVWAQLDNIFSLIARRSDIDRAEAYAAGFRSAATMLIAGLTNPYRKGAA